MAGPPIRVRVKTTAPFMSQATATPGVPMIEEAAGSSPSVSRHPWSTALLLATMATPAGVVFAWLAPRPLDAVVALPLVLVDVWATSRGVTGTPSHEAPVLRLLLLGLGIGLTWLFYVLVARLVLWRLSLHAGDEVDSAD